MRWCPKLNEAGSQGELMEEDCRRGPEKSFVFIDKNLTKF